MRLPRTQFVERVAFAEGYRVSADGHRVTGPSGKLCWAYPDKWEYLKVTIRMPSGRFRSCGVHRLQAFQKYGEQIYGPGVEVRHFDGRKPNNSVANIVLGTKSENAMDKPPEVRRRAALIAANSPRLYKQAEIRRHYAEHGSAEYTMREFGLQERDLHRILNAPVSPRFAAAAVALSAEESLPLPSSEEAGL